MRERTQTGEAGSIPETLISNWNGVEEKTIEAVRLRHRSYSTEKTYISWLRQFQGFVKCKVLQSLDGKDLQDFCNSSATLDRIYIMSIHAKGRFAAANLLSCQIFSPPVNYYRISAKKCHFLFALTVTIK